MTLATELAGELDLPVRAATSWQEACDRADVVCAATHASEPVVRREWLAAGTHVTSVGYHPQGREVDDATVADSLVVVESRATALVPAPAGSNDPRSNDLLQPSERGLLKPEQVVEIGELIAGTRPGRTSPEQLTLYKSVGVAVQDGVAAALVLRIARERGVGQMVDL